MSKTLLGSGVLAMAFAVALAAVVACSGSTTPPVGGGTSGTSGGPGTSGGGGAPATPQQQVSVTSPTSGLAVTATIAAATLGEECAASKGTADCAPSQEGGFAPGGCGGCQKSSVQIAFDVTSGTGTAKVQVVSVTLHDAASGKQLDELKADNPQQWSGSTYAPWDQSLSADLKASYDLSSPAWSTIVSPDGRLAYQTPYRLRVTLSIDGVQVMLESVDITREPPVVT